MLAAETLIGPGKQDVLIPESLRKLPLPEHLRNTHSKEQDIPAPPEVGCTRSSWLADERNQMAVAKAKAEKAKLEGEDEGD